MSVNSNYAAYSSSLEALKGAYQRYPRVVSLETFVSCNAACTFCPYPQSPRQGQRMDDGLFYKIISDLQSIPESHRFLLSLARINEPLLDKRLKEFSLYIDSSLSGADQIFWSNGSTLVKGKFEWMGLIKHSTLVVSLNSVDEKKHTDLMGFGVTKVLGNLDYLHQLKASGDFPSNVVLNAPYQSQAQSLDYLKFCKKRWPLFDPHILPFFTWQGDIAAGEQERQESMFFNRVDADIPSLVANLGCGQWFDIHILANGQVTKCCIDEAGHKQRDYDVRLNHVLDIYAKSMGLRQNLPARSRIVSCETCTHLG